VGTECRGQHFDGLRRLPPCADESGGFLSPGRWRLSHSHPYQDYPRLAGTHGHLRETAWTVDQYTAQAVPFRWLNRDNVDDWVQPKIASPLPGDDPLPPGMASNWVFSPPCSRRRSWRDSGRLSLRASR
jgi:hypothetical protein